MIHISLQFRWFFFKLLRSLLSIYLLLFSSYLFLDYSMNLPKECFWRYLSQLLITTDFFLPFSFTLALIQMMHSLSAKREILALQAGGFSTFKIVRPIYCMTLLLMLLAYANNEFFREKAYSWGKPDKSFRAVNLPFEVKVLPDHSRLIFQIDAKGAAYDLFWIRSPTEIWHAKQVEALDNKITGHFVDLLKRNDRAVFERTDSFTEYTFPSILTPDCLLPSTNNSAKILPYSIANIRQLLSDPTLTPSQDRAFLTTTLCHKLLLPWLPLLFATAALPSFFRYERKNNRYLLYGFTLIGIFSFYSLTSIAVSLGENYIMTPWLTLIFIPLLLLSFLSYRLAKA